MTSRTDGIFLYGPDERADQEYWTSELNGGEPGTLPMSRARSAVPVLDQPSLDYVMPGDTSTAVHGLTNGSPMLTLAVVASGVLICLRRYGTTGQVRLGTPTHDAVEKQVLPVGVAPDPTTTFHELLAKVRDRLVAAYAHQNFPLDKLDDDLGTPFHVRVEIDGHSDDVAPAGNDLTIRLAASGGAIGGTLTYSHRLFDSATVRRFAGHLATVLAEGLARPDAAIDDLGILTEGERVELATLSVSRPPGHPDPATVHDLLLRQAAETPDTPAIVDGEVTLSYRDLSSAAQAVAARLVAAGVRPGDIVGLHTQRTHAAMVAAVGILATGAAYLPLDPDLPRSRLETMVETAGARVVMSADRGTVLGAATVLDIVAAAAPDALPLPAADADSPAYVMFTSGSTGVAKGVEMPHRALVNLLRWQHEQSGEAGGTGRTIIRTPLWFDVSFQEIFATLGFGGTAVVAEPGLERDPAGIVRLMVDERVERAFLPFVALQQLVREAGRARARLADLREIITAGEQLKVSAPLVEFFRAHTGCVLRNQYGPTETHVVTSYTLQGRPTRWPGLPPIGRPVHGAAIHVLDESMRPVPIGVTGQLAVSGVPLANGYRGDRALTEQRFVTGTDVADRLYLTGDLARRRADGNIEFQGRADRQLKIRGHRVEPGEIETLLMRHAGVEQAAVVGRTDEDDQTHLAAYVVATPALESEADLRAHLSNLLPAYQIPRTFTVMPDLPLTNTGKVDTEALPEPRRPGPLDTRRATPPRTDVEVTLATIWRQVLKLDQVGIFDHFLELGGDSIIATQAVAAANDAGLNINMKDFFAHPTIAELAVIVPETRQTRTERDDDYRPAPLTPVQRWFAELNLPSRDHWNISVLLRPTEHMAADLVQHTLRQLVARHEALGTTFSGGDQMGRPLPPEIVVRVPEATVPAGTNLETFLTEVAQRAHREVRVADGPLLVAVVVRGHERGDDRLLIVVHHAVVDGVSWRVLLDEFQTIYRGLADGSAGPLPRRTSSYQTWALALREYAASPQARDELEYWAAIPAKPVRPLPSNRPGPGVEATSRRVEVAFSAAESELLLRDLPAKYHARIEEILVSCLFDAVRQWTGEPALLMEFEGHGRGAILPDIDVTRTVGWFSTMYPLELRVDDASTATSGDLLGAVKNALRAVPNRGIGYGILRHLAPAHETRALLAGRPRPEIKFNYLGQFDAQFGSTAMFEPATEDTGPMVAPDGERPVLLYVQGHLVEGRLHFFLEYSDECHDEAEMRLVIDRFKECVVRLVEQRDHFEDGALTPSDFSATNLDPAALETLLGQVES